MGCVDSVKLVRTQQLTCRLLHHAHLQSLGISEIYLNWRQSIIGRLGAWRRLPLIQNKGGTVRYEIAGPGQQEVYVN
jgi:hypothetical protein